MFNKKYFGICFLFFVYAIFVCFFSYSFISAEDKIYECMYVESNVNFFDLFSIQSSSYLQYWKDIFNTITTWPLNFLIILPLYPFFVLFGDRSREGFIIGLQLFYMVPLMAILLKFFFNRLSKYNEKNTLFNIYALFSILFFLPIHYLVLRGYASIVSFIPLFVLLYMSLQLNFEEKLKVRDIFIFSILLYLTFHLRRFLLIADFSVIATVIIFSLYRIFKTEKKTFLYILNKMRLLITNLFFSSFLFIALFYIFQRDNFITYFQFSNDIYSAYNTLSFQNNLKVFLYHFGYLNTILFVILILIALFVKDKFRKNAIFLIFVSLIYLGSFLFYEVFSEYLIFFYILYLLIFLYVFSLFVNKTSTFYSKLIVNIFLLIFFSYSFSSFLVLFLPKNSFSETIYSAIEKIYIKPDGYMKFYPYSFTGKESFIEIYDFIKKETSSKSGLCITTYAISDLFNYWLLYSYSSFDDKVIKNKLYRTAEYFTFEGIEAENLDSEYVIVTDPIRLHFDEKDFLPLFRAGQAFINNNSIAKNYELIFKKEYEYSRFSFSPTVVVYIFKKIKPVEPELVKELYDGIVSEAPQFKDIYEQKYKEYVDFYNKKYNE